ncbi:MAG: MFS transporter, partial [Planctomycetota bacterium]
MRKYRVILVAVSVELLLGFKYAWGIFDRVLQRDYGFTATQTQLVFSMTVAVFAAAFLISGRIQDRFGPRVTTLIGAFFYGTGLLIAGLGGPRFATLFVGAGVMMGLAVAFGYIGPLATAVKWFPARKGAVTGVVIGAYGFGAFFVGSAAQALLARGLTPFRVFLIVGIVGSALMALLSLGLSLPEEYRKTSKTSLRLPEGFLKGAHFWALAAGLFAGTFAGLVVVGSVQRIGGSLGAPEWAVVIAVQAFAAGSVSGRVGWGLLL